MLVTRSTIVYHERRLRDLVGSPDTDLEPSRSGTCQERSWYSRV
jgi:hypothetical protein